MDQSTDVTQLNQSGLQSLLGGQTPSLIPESLVTTLTVGFIVLNVLSVLFLIFYVVGMVRKWKVESAVLHMQKDVADIKIALAARSQPNMDSPIAPASNNHVIAKNDLPDRDLTTSELS